MWELVALSKLCHCALDGEMIGAEIRALFGIQPALQGSLRNSREPDLESLRTSGNVSERNWPFRGFFLNPAGTIENK